MKRGITGSHRLQILRILIKPIGSYYGNDYQDSISNFERRTKSFLASDEDNCPHPYLLERSPFSVMMLFNSWYMVNPWRWVEHLQVKCSVWTSHSTENISDALHEHPVQTNQKSNAIQQKFLATFSQYPTIPSLKYTGIWVWLILCPMTIKQQSSSSNLNFLPLQIIETNI